MKLIRVAFVFTITAFGLSACGSSQPSVKEAQAAIGTEFAQVSGGSMNVVGYRDFKLSRCRDAAPADGVICHLGGEVVLDVSGTELVRPIVEPVRFSKSSGIWTAHKP